MVCRIDILVLFAFFVAAVAGCGDDDITGVRGAHGAPSGGSGANAPSGGTGAGTPEDSEIQVTLEDCCDSGGQFDQGNPVCADFLSRSGLDPIDFCTIGWPPQTATPSAPFAEPICDLDCTDLSAPGVVGCIEGPFGGSFSYSGRTFFELTVRDGEPFGWVLRRVGGDPDPGSALLRYEFSIAGGGAPVTGTYPLASSGVAFLQAGYFSQNIPEPRPTYFYKTDDIIGAGSISFFQAPNGVGDEVTGAFDYAVSVRSYLTAEIADPMPAGSARIQACFALSATSG